MIDRALFVGWAALFAAGGLLVAIVRRRDRARPSPVSHGLPGKYLTFLLITLALLPIGALPRWGTVMLLAAGALMMLRELARAGCGEPQDRPGPQGSPRLGVHRTRGGGEPTREGRWVRALVGTWIVAGLAGALALEGLDPTGNAWAYMWTIVATTDGFSQLFGQAWGRRSLAPTISPGKTWEGLAGGTATALLAGLGLSGLFPHLGWGRCALLALATSLAASAGDLAESAAKRALGIKDFGAALGHHGGLLDRFDSLLGGAPVFALGWWTLGN